MHLLFVSGNSFSESLLHASWLQSIEGHINIDFSFYSKVKNRRVGLQFDSFIGKCHSKKVV